MKMIKKASAIAIAMFMALTVFPLSTEASHAATNPATSQYKIQDRLDQLATLDGTYFTPNGKRHGAYADSKHSCNSCNNYYVISKNAKIKKMMKLYKGRETIYKNSYIPKHAGTDSGMCSSEGWSCWGFANFAEWYLYSEDYKTKVTTERVKQKVPFNYDTFKNYAKPGDVLRCDLQHSAVVYSFDKKGVTVIDGNWDNHCIIKKHKIPYSTYKKVGIARGKTYTSAYTHQFSYDANGGSGSVSGFSVKDGQTFMVTQTAPYRDGYIFCGWSVKRLRDQTWLSDGKWTNKPGAYTLYTSKNSYTVEQSWRKNAASSIKMKDGADSNYKFTAVWSNKIKPANLGADFIAAVTSKSTGKNLTVSGSNVQTASSNNNADTYQKWRFIRQSNGSYKILNAGSNKVLDAYGARSSNGTNIQVAGNNDSTAQRWYICSYGGGYVLVPVYCDLMMDVDTDKNINVQLWGRAATYSTIGSNHIFSITADNEAAKAKTINQPASPEEEPEVEHEEEPEVQPAEEPAEIPSGEPEEIVEDGQFADDQLQEIIQ